MVYWPRLRAIAHTETCSSSLFQTFLTMFSCIKQASLGLSITILTHVKKGNKYAPPVPQFPLILHAQGGRPTRAFRTHQP
jgi:hypothetical protein